MSAALPLLDCIDLYCCCCCCGCDCCCAPKRVDLLVAAALLLEEEVLEVVGIKSSDVSSSRIIGNDLASAICGGYSSFFIWEDVLAFLSKSNKRDLQVVNQ